MYLWASPRSYGLHSDIPCVSVVPWPMETIGLELFGEDISDFTGYVELTFKVNQSSIVLKFKGNKPYFDKKPYFQTEKSNIPSDALNSIEEITKKKDAISKVVLVVTGFEGTTFTLPIKKECKIYFN